MTFADLVTSVNANIYPEGMAENLATLHRQFVVLGLIDLQTKIPELRNYHRDTVPFDATRYYRWSSVFDCPDGKVSGVSVLSGGDCEDEVHLRYILPEQMDQLQNDLVRSRAAPATETTYDVTVPASGAGSDWETTNSGYGATTPYDPSAVIPSTGTVAVTFASINDCYKVAGSVADRKTDTRYGFFTLKEGHVVMLPRLRSTESATIRWSGIKKSWADTDTVSIDVDVQAALEDYADAQRLRRIDRMLTDAAAALGEYNSKVAHLIFQYRDAAWVDRRYPTVSQTQSTPGVC